MTTDYREKAKEKEAEKDRLIEHSKELTDQAMAFFKTKFIWKSGEYILKVNAKTTNDIANISKKYRLTIFESHTEQLMAITEHYKLGGGIWWNPERVQTSVILPITEA